MTNTASQTGLLAGTWAIDAAHTTVGFTARHLMSKVRGHFAEFTGEIVTTENPLESTVNVHIVSSSITTGNEQRDGHLRSADFFSPETGGELTFTSTAVTPAGDDYVITGDLTINGITKSVDLAAEFLGVDVNPWGQTVLGAEAKTTIDRHDFKVDWNVPLDGGRFLVGAKIEITLSIEAIKA